MDLCTYVCIVIMLNCSVQVMDHLKMCLLLRECTNVKLSSQDGSSVFWTAMGISNFSLSLAGNSLN